MDQTNEMALRLSLSSDEEPTAASTSKAAASASKAATASSTLANGNVTVRKRSMFVLSL